MNEEGNKPATKKPIVSTLTIQLTLVIPSSLTDKLLFLIPKN